MRNNFATLSISLFTILLIFTGCRSHFVERRFEEFGSSGLSLETPNNWDAEYDERSVTISLRGEKGLWNKDSISIIIQPFILLSSSDINPEKELEANIERLETHFYSNSLTILQMPTMIEDEDYEVATARISIPSSEGSSSDKDDFRIVDIIAMKCNDDFAIIYIYKSDNDELNTEADDIIKSIQLGCLIKQ